MKNRKNSFLPVLIIAIVLFVTTCGSVFALMKTKTPVIENTIEPANVSCELTEDFNQEENKKTAIRVENTGNVDAYIRVCLVTYCVNIDDPSQIMAYSSQELDFSFDRENWIEETNNIYYYKKQVAPETVVELLGGNTIELAKVYNEEKDEYYLQKVDVFAEAIQAIPAEAVKSSWKISVDANGNITAVPLN